MRVIFLGTGTSDGVPMIGCTCATCRSADSRDRRWRPSILLELDGGARVLVDTATDLRAQALAFGVTAVDAILFTHSHADHILGLDEVRRLNVRRGAPVPGYGDEATVADIRRSFHYIFDPDTRPGGGIPQIALFTIVGPFVIGGQEIVPVPLHHGDRLILGFRVGRFAYLTDTNRIPDRSWRLVDGLDVLVLDALRERAHPTHFSLSEAVEVAGRIGARATYFTHICHDLPHAATCARLPASMDLAYDGLVLDV